MYKVLDFRFVFAGRHIVEVSLLVSGKACSQPESCVVKKKEKKEENVKLAVMR